MEAELEEEGDREEAAREARRREKV
uniref:Uncharacterized protein n=1 Tax=Arundo donax TaxID=35708 RepID=A0A0A8ZUM0_ARUDO